MNKIVREHYPVNRLPEDLREGLNPNDVVRVVIEEAHAERSGDRSADELRKLIEEARRTAPLDQDSVARVRKLRDEWDH
jgi:hypothetical protein